MKRLIYLISVLTLTLSFALPAQAVTKAECGEWLCLPVGFAPSGCHASKKAYKHRIKHFKPALPDFAKCMLHPPGDDNNQPQQSKMEHKEGVAAWVPAHTICDEINNYECTAKRTVSGQYIRGTKCIIDKKERTSTPAGCTASYHWSEVYIDGQLSGAPYYSELK